MQISKFLKIKLLLLVTVLFNVYAGFMLNEEIQLTGFPYQKSILTLKLEDPASLARYEPTFGTPNASCNYLGAQLGGVLASLEKDQCIIIATGEFSNSGNFVAHYPESKALFTSPYPRIKVIPATRIVKVIPFDEERVVVAPFLIACYLAIMAVVGWCFSRLLREKKVAA